MLPHMVYAGSLMFSPPNHPVDLRDFSQWWTFAKGAHWRHPYGPGSNIRGLDDHPVVHVAFSDRSPTRNGPARNCQPKRNGNLRRAAGSRVPNLRGAMNSHRTTVTWPIPGRVNSLARTPMPTVLNAPRRSPHSRRTVWPPRHDRQRLGMDGRLVFAKASGGCGESMLHSEEPARRARGRQLRPPNDQRQDSTEGHQRRLAFVRAELLPTLPAGCAPCGAGGHIHEPSRLSMYQAMSLYRCRRRSARPARTSRGRPQSNAYPSSDYLLGCRGMASLEDRGNTARLGICGIPWLVGGELPALQGRLC